MEGLELRLALSGSPIWVSNTDDAGDGSLRDAIEEANARPGEDTIKFRTSAWDTIALSSQLLITDDLVIDGPGSQKASVSGQDTVRVFLVLPESLADDPFVSPTSAQLETSPEVTIRKLTIQDGLATDAPGNPSPGPFAFGGGVYNLGGTVHLEKVELTGNRATGLLAAAGAVANEFGGSLTVSRSDFVENTSDGTLVGVGGAISSDLGSTVESFSVDGSGTVPFGFPLSGEDPRPHFIDVGTLTVGDSTLTYTGQGTAQTFSEDLNTGTGTFGSADPFVFTDADGDTLVTYYGRTDIVPSAQEAGTFALFPANLHPDGLPFDPGDVYAHWIAEFVVQPESTGKYAGASGSWIMDAYSAPFPAAAISPSGVDIPLQYRWESRGDVQLVFPTDPPEVEVDRSSFESNSASATLGHIPTEGFSGLAGGGAILNVTGLMSIDRSTFIANSVQGGAGIGGAVKGGPGFGGAINSSNISPFGAAQSVLEVRNSSFIDNTAIGGDGGATGPEGGEASGGAIKITNAGEAHLERNEFEGNTAIGGNGIDGANGGAATGGAVGGSAGALLNVHRNSFSENSVDGGASDGGAGGVGRGGALGLFSVDLTGWIPGLTGSAHVSRSDFADNTATGGLGGGIYNEGELTVAKSSFAGNEAIGTTDVIIALNPAQTSVGGAAGGAIANFNELTVTHSRFGGNLARGADDADSGDNSFLLGEPVFAGGGYAGAIMSAGGSAQATIEASHFVDNVAEAGDGGAGEFAALGIGGALLSDSQMTVVGSSFRGNAAIAGDDSVSPFHNGHALGGAIASGSLLPAAVPTNPGGSLIVEKSQFVGNEAIGGNNNLSTLPPESIPVADAPNNAYGGGILVYQGTASLSGSTLRGNEVRAGVGGADKNGGVAVGGGAFFFSFLGAVTAEVESSLFYGNVAAGADGGDGIGGGIAVGTLGAPFGAPGVTSIHHTKLMRNEARGGDGLNGGDGIGGGLAVAEGGIAELRNSSVLLNKSVGGNGVTNGGNGLGGGVATVDGGSVDIVRSVIFGNLAKRGLGGAADGVGLGGGGYNDGAASDFELDAFSLFWIQFNAASDDGDDIFGLFDVL